ncbi:HDIG domain-containing protein [Paenibacillus sp. 1_12]|uniref:HD-GYP domain-containing protein n=1 Tax=Paenibacillus sp. 1_12 TaxID=1566278 RepID=UPI0008E86F5B|nr:HD domain-containing phosphohydrolase [Paenibacillus sp. 1_12]SFL12196.1 HDIG domain-containing protein [Paenibacillus sp. 1_12]
MRDHFMMELLTYLKKKDLDTYEHSIRVGRMAESIAFYFGFNEAKTNHLVKGCYLHDIGKIGIPQNILSKSTGLDPDEWETMKKHPSLGAEMLQAYASVDQEIIDIITYHHERLNGEGYPYGLVGEQIPELARWCSIIDSFDCMLSDRPYRKRLSLQEAQNELLLQSDKQFDKYMVNMLLNLPDIALNMY